MQDTNPRLGDETRNPKFQAEVEKCIDRTNMAFLIQYKEENAVLQDKLHHETMKHRGLSAPTFVGREGLGSGISQRYPGRRARISIQRQFAEDAVEQETNPSKANKARRRLKKSRAERLEPGESSRAQPSAQEKKRKSENQGEKDAKRR